MDKRLFDAAWTGNVEYLLKLIEDDPFTLHVVALAGGETPLHVACMAGHLDFTREVLKLRREFSKEMNQDGFTPLHIASANGDVEMVKELLKIDCNLCTIEGRERRIPLHNAAIKGRVGVIRELLSASVDSTANATARGETALHLAVKNNQFEVLKVLVEHLKEFSKEDVLNKKDDHGNTILHLAVSRKQYEVINLIVNKDVTKGMVEMNPLNTRALTPLDVLLLFQSEAGDREIEEMLRRAGALKAEEFTQDQVGNTNNASDEQPRTNQARSRAQRLVEYFKQHNIKDSPREVRNSLLVIAILMVTATYQAVLSPPGGVWQDDSATASPPHTAGKAIMGSYNAVAYSLFLVFNSLGFFMSIYMIQFLTIGFRMQLELNVALFALVVTYDTCMTAIAPNFIFGRLFTAISIAMPFMIPIATNVLRNRLKGTRSELPSTDQASAQV